MLLAYRDGHNAYVDAQGQWRGHDIPASLRRYSFSLAKRDGDAEDSDAYHLAIDPNAPQLSTTEGTPLFDGDQLAAEVQQRIELLKGLEAQRRLTQAAVRQIEQLGLFKMEQLTLQQGEHVLVNIAGLRSLDQDAFNRLDGPALKTLHDSGALALIHAHRFSLANLQRGPLREQLQAATPKRSGYSWLDDASDSLQFQF